MVSVIPLLMAVGVATIGLQPASAASLERRRFWNPLNVCLTGCKRGTRSFLQCKCNPGSEGACCDQCALPKPIETVEIDLEKFIKATWYIHKQQENGYQKADSLFCVAATYGAESRSVPLNFEGRQVVAVDNYSNKERVNGPVMGGPLCARVDEGPGKLSVAPCFLPNAFGGPYWIMEVGEDENGEYSWAVIIGGEPKDFGSDDKCTTSETNVNNSGLWLFTRSQEYNQDHIDEMLKVLEKQGVSATKLKDVVQEGCEYKDAVLKFLPSASP